MNDLFLIGALLLLMTLAFRVRGGFPATGSTTVARLVAAVVTAGTAFALTKDVYALAAIGTFFALTLPHGQWQDMSVVEENDDFTGMWGRDMITATVPALTLEYLGYQGAWMIPTVGFFSAGGYWLASKTLAWVRLGKFVDGFTSIGELNRGFVLGLGMVLTTRWDEAVNLVKELL